MSATAYGVLSWRRELSKAGESTATEPPGVKSYMDVLAALVPSEALTFHALVLAQSSTSETNTTTGAVATTITDPNAMWWAFWGCLVLSIVLYCFGHGAAEWDNWDYLRALIPPSAFVGWAMLQRGTAFDAVFPTIDAGTRFVFALFIAIVLGGFATWLSTKADQKQGAGGGNASPETAAQEA
ncbi:MAG: hypothetical protein JST60_05420 [Chloroflexi bacterium SZAS-1]|nr:hypothetical protein [Chloroflexi bacterium SZAS-1]